MNKAGRPNQRSGLEGEKPCRRLVVGGKGGLEWKKEDREMPPPRRVLRSCTFKTRKRKAIAMAAASGSSHRGSCPLP